jgi:23S rRNA G2445 N2-methylase RlmL
MKQDADTGRLTFFASCSPGLEKPLLMEARALKLGKPEGQPGGVEFTGTMEDAWRANLHLRTASRVLLRLARFPAPDQISLYRGVAAVDWERFLTPDGTFLVHGRTVKSNIDNDMFVSMKTKDAVADVFRDKHGRRPSIDKEAPDVRIHIRLNRDRAILLVDTSGEPLFKRGWRKEQGLAPLRETLAAGCLMLSGWDKRAPLLDPFVGSGTILIEGALMAGGIPPGAFRDSYGFERFPGHDAARWQAMRSEAIGKGAVPKKLRLIGTDSDGSAIRGAIANIESAGLAGRIEVSRQSAGAFSPRPGWNAFIVTNPPYGERIGKMAPLVDLYRKFGKTLRERCVGYTAAVLCGNPELIRELDIGGTRHPMKNGGLDCELTVATIGG